MISWDPPVWQADGHAPVIGRFPPPVNLKTLRLMADVAADVRRRTRILAWDAKCERINHSGYYLLTKTPPPYVGGYVGGGRSGAMTGTLRQINAKPSQ